MNSCYVFLGDSITDGGRLFLPGHRGLGQGYVRLIADSLAEAGQPSTVINKGHDGFTVSRLLSNLEADCFPYDPDLVTILVGINNIAVARNTGRSLEEQGFYEDYGRLLDQITERTHAQILCMGPFVFPWPREYLYWMDDVATVEAGLQRIVASRGRARFLPLNASLNEAAQRLGYSRITTDGIHLTALGHEYLSRIWTG